MPSSRIAETTRARRQRHGVLIDGLAAELLDAGGVQRQSATEGAAQIVALGQFPGMDREQLLGAGEKRDIELPRPRHKPNLSAGRSTAGGLE